MQLWERRPHHDDFLSAVRGARRHLVAAGSREPRRQAAGEGRRRAQRRRPAAPRRSPSSSPRAASSGSSATGAARARDGAQPLCQAAVHHGPADLTIGVFVDEGREPDWELGEVAAAHAQPGRRRRPVAVGPARAQRGACCAASAAGAGERHGPGRARLRPADRGPQRARSRAAGRRASAPPSAGRSAERLPVAGIVVSSSRDRLPAACTTVIEIVSPDGDAIAYRTDDRRQRSGAAGRRPGSRARPPAAARATWRASRTPSCSLVGAGLPDSVAPAAAARARRRSTPTRSAVAGSAPARRRRPSGPVGVTEHGVFSARPRARRPARARRRHHRLGQERAAAQPDRRARRHHRPAAAHVPADGLQGRRGVRRLRAAPAHGRDGHRPRRGASSSARCARSRPSCEYRERQLREAGADNLRAYHERDHAEPMPRLVVVIDEFAKMAREQPELLAALVDVAQRGRTLGVHLILATQRPAGRRSTTTSGPTRTCGSRCACRTPADSTRRDRRPLGRRDQPPPARPRVLPARRRRGPPDPDRADHLRDRRDQRHRRRGHRRSSSARRRPSGEARRARARRSTSRPISRGWSTRSSRPTPPRASRRRASRGRSRCPRTIDLAELIGAQRRRPRAGRAGGRAAQARRSTRSAGTSTRATCCSSASPAAARRPRWRASCSASPSVHPPEAARGLRARLRRRRPAGARGAAAHRLGRPRRRSRAPDAADPVAAPRSSTSAGPPVPSGATTVVLIDNLAALRAEFDDVAGMELMDALAPRLRRRPAGRHPPGGHRRPRRTPSRPRGWRSRPRSGSSGSPIRYDYVSLGLTIKDVPPATPGPRRDGARTGCRSSSGGRGRRSASAAAAVAGRYRRRTPAATPIGVLPTEVACDRAIASLSVRSHGASASACGSPISGSPSSCSTRASTRSSPGPLAAARA